MSPCVVCVCVIHNRRADIYNITSIYCVAIHTYEYIDVNLRNTLLGNQIEHFVIVYYYTIYRVYNICRMRFLCASPWRTHTRIPPDNPTTRDYIVWLMASNCKCSRAQGRRRRRRWRRRCRRQRGVDDDILKWCRQFGVSVERVCVCDEYSTLYVCEYYDGSTAFLLQFDGDASRVQLSTRARSLTTTYFLIQ